MSDASNDPEVFLTQVDDAMQDVVDEINNYLEKATSVVDAAIASASAGLSGFGGAVKGFFTGGIPGAISGGIEGYVDELVDQLTKESDEVHEAWAEAQGTINDAIGSLLGDPLKMSSISSAYRDAIEQLGQVRNGVAAADSYVSETWQGLAKTAYTNTSTFQLKALDGVSTTLAEAADLLDDHAVKLISYWADQLQNLVDLAAGIAAEAAALGDIGNWATIGAGPIVSIIATAASGATSIVTTAVTYWADLNVGMAGDWDAVQSKFGERGLEGDQWPDFTSVDRNRINDPWEPA